jgi:hypothetical protein
MAAERVVSKYAQEKSKNRFEELSFFVVSGKIFLKKGIKHYNLLALVWITQKLKKRIKWNSQDYFS